MSLPQVTLAELQKAERIRKIADEIKLSDAEAKVPGKVKLSALAQLFLTCIEMHVTDERLRDLAIDKFMESYTHAKRGTT